MILIEVMLPCGWGLHVRVWREIDIRSVNSTFFTSVMPYLIDGNNVMDQAGNAGSRPRCCTKKAYS